MKQAVLLFVFFGASFFLDNLIAQEQLGAIQDNYSPVNGSLMNPSAMVDQKPWLDINIVGVGAYARNNFVFIPDSYLPSGNINDPITKDPEKDLYGYVSAGALGPSFTLALKDHSIGFHSAVRGVIFIKNVPSPTATLAENGRDASVADGRYFERNIRAKELTWEEYGISYGKIFSKKHKDMMSAAITVNRLYGIHSTGLYIKNGDLEVINQEGELINLEGKYWYNEPARKAGKGFSGSFGFTYKKMKKDISNYVPHSVFGSCQIIPYKHKLGISLVDIGAIRFKKEALVNSFDENTNVDTLEDLADASEAALLQAEKRKFTAWLPAAASVQYDYNMEHNFYFNASIVHRLSVPSFFGTERAHLLSTSIRWETKPFTISVPFSLHAYRHPQLGLSIRLWSILIGTDNLFPLIKKQDSYAADIYVFFKLPFFKSPQCRKRKNPSKKNKGVMNKFMCPAW